MSNDRAREWWNKNELQFDGNLTGDYDVPAALNAYAASETARADAAERDLKIAISSHKAISSERDQFAKQATEYFKAKEAAESALRASQQAHMDAVGRAQADFSKEEAAHLQTIDERDKWESELSRLADVAGCTQEWSSNHDHGRCISDAFEASEERNRQLQAENDVLVRASSVPTRQLAELHLRNEKRLTMRIGQLQERVRVLTEAMRSVESLIHFYAKREMEAPSNNQEAVRDTRDKLRKFDAALSPESKETL